MSKVKTKSQIMFKNGDYYEGEVIQNSMEGKGIYKFKIGSTYEGQFKDNQFEGRGRLIDVFNEMTIVGEFSKNFAHGEVRITYQDSSLYEGQLYRGLRHGKGIYRFGNKQSPQSQYSGMFIDDAFEGYGELQYKNGDIYKGEFSKGIFQGKGQLKTSEYSYIGNFKNGMIEGKGLIRYESRQSYEGNFQINRKHGYGTYTYLDGIVFQGNWENDKRHGKGKLIFCDKSTFQGQFYNDYYESQGIYRFNQWELIGEFRKSVLQGPCLMTYKLKVFIQMVSNLECLLFKKNYSTVVRSLIVVNLQMANKIIIQFHILIDFELIK